MAWSARALADALGLRVLGDGGRAVERVASLESADETCLAFLSRAAFADRLAATRAGVVIVGAAHAERVPGVALVADNPYAAYARAAQLLHPMPARAPGIADSAQVAADAAIGTGVHVGPFAVVEAGASLGDDTVIGAGAYVGERAEIAAGCRLSPRVVVHHECRIGRRCLLQSGAVVGSDGFGYAEDGGEWVRIPQVGRAVLGDDVHVGANTTIDRGSLDDTCIGDGVILDNQIQIAHNVRVGEHTAMAGCVGVAGSAVIGRRCTIGGAAVVLGHLEVVDDVHITAMSLVTRSITDPGTYSSGVPLEDNAAWRRNAARFRQLDRIARRVSALERAGPSTDSEGDLLE